LKGLSILINSNEETIYRFDIFIFILLGLNDEEILLEYVSNMLEILSQVIILNFGETSVYYSEIIISKIKICLENDKIKY
jgi:hypothetical protein